MLKNKTVYALPYIQIIIYCLIECFVYFKECFSISKSGKATPVRVNILIRSMGPISEADMVTKVLRKEHGSETSRPLRKL